MEMMTLEKGDRLSQGSHSMQGNRWHISLTGTSPWLNTAYCNTPMHRPNLLFPLVGAPVELAKNGKTLYSNTSISRMTKINDKYLSISLNRMKPLSIVYGSLVYICKTLLEDATWYLMSIQSSVSYC